MQADVRGRHTGRHPDSLSMWNAGEFLCSRRCGGGWAGMILTWYVVTGPRTYCAVHGNPSSISVFKCLDNLGILRSARNKMRMMTAIATEILVMPNTPGITEWQEKPINK